MLTLSLPGAPGLVPVDRHVHRARRLRVRVPGLRGRPDVARRIERALSEADLDVESFRIDVRSGRVLLRYAPGARLLERLGERATAGRRRRRVEPPPEGPWHALPAEDVLSRLGSGPKGLDESEASERNARHGPNTVEDVEPRPRWRVLASQVDNLPARLLVGSSLLSTLSGELLDAGAILSAVGLDAGIGYRIERRNELLLTSWRKLEAGEARVLREGRLRKLPPSRLCPGDVLVVRAGETVPADARVIDAHRLACDESILTGESEVRAKTPERTAENVPLAERTSMLFAGTTVVTGRGRAVVTAIASGTESARIRELLEREKPPPTPFERRLDRLTGQLAWAGAGAGLLSGAANLLRLERPGRVIGDAVALAVAAIPEGLPVVSTAALVRSMERMREQGMVVRRLVSAETLGGVTVVCADKTGTLTRNEMILEAVDVGGRVRTAEGLRAEPEKIFDDPTTLILAASVLNSDLELHGHREGLTVSGSPTEKAILTAAEAAGLDCRALVDAYPRRVLRERAQGRPYVASRHAAPDGGGWIAFLKGAPEAVAALCDREGASCFDESARADLLRRNRELAEQGLRVLAVAWRRLEGDADSELDGGYTLVGLLGLRDPLREGAAETVRKAAAAGIRTVILTGDQRPTAEAVARAVGLGGQEVLEGEAVARLLAQGGPAIRERLRRVAAVTRVTPSDKAALVRALREAGEVVAMAGDGVNDAPAIRAADVGIAIGSRASDVSREAADIVLASEDLESILRAIGEGRVVQDNLRRAVRYQLASNSAETLVVLATSLVGVRMFNPTRLLWLNLVTDSLPAIALALEPADGDVLARPPAPPDAPLIDPAARRALWRDGLWLTGIGLGALALAGPSVAFSTFVGADVGYAIACRAPGSPPGEQFTELLGTTAAIHLAGITLPPVRRLLRLPPRVGPGEILGFGIGFMIPWIVSRASLERVVVRSGRPQATESFPQSADSDTQKREGGSP